MKDNYKDFSKIIDLILNEENIFYEDIKKWLDN